MKKYVALLIVIALGVVAFVTSEPPNVVEPNVPDSVFSARRAFPFLTEICKAPHSTGTAENARVRDYIAEYCRTQGLDVTIQHSNSVWQRGSSMLAANVYNVVARLKGTGQTGKSVVVMAHYDSQPNTPGAGDDGAGCAAMLETIRMMTLSGNHFTNDIIFLFTDGEESGLSGAAAFVQDSSFRKESGIVLNFEGRGNSGASSMFEVNPENGWAITHFKKAAMHPVGNSLGYEIYKVLPNDTDYTMFRRMGIAGLNHAFADGLVNYHSPNDTPENLDLRSLQQHGDNLVSLLGHFADQDLTNTKSEDITFFNPVGEWLVTYPASWNLYFTILTLVLVIGYVYAGIRLGKMRWKGLLAGFFSLIGVIVVSIGATIGLIWLINKGYPLYSHYYANNFYNVHSYFLVITAVLIALFVAVYGWLLRKVQYHSLMAGVCLFVGILMTLMQMSMATAVFVLMVPLLFLTLGHLVMLHTEETAGAYWAAKMVSMMPTALWMPPLVWQMFVIFGLSPAVAGVSLIIVLSLGMILPAIKEAIEEKARWFALGSLALGILVFVVAHMNSGYSVDQPLRSNLYYVLEADSSKATWNSDFTSLDEFNRKYLEKATWKDGRLKGDAELISLAAPEAKVVSDTVMDGKRTLTLKLLSPRGAFTMRMRFDETAPAAKLVVVGPAGRQSDLMLQDEPIKTLNYIGLDSAGVTIIVETLQEAPVWFTLTDRSLGLPGAPVYPPGIIPGTDYSANSTFVTRRYRF